MPSSRRGFMAAAVALVAPFCMLGCGQDNNAELLKSGPPGQAVPSTPSNYAERAKQYKPGADQQYGGAYPGAKK